VLAKKSVFLFVFFFLFDPGGCARRQASDESEKPSETRNSEQNYMYLVKNEKHFFFHFCSLVILSYSVGSSASWQIGNHASNKKLSVEAFFFFFFFLFLVSPRMRAVAISYGTDMLHFSSFVLTFFFFFLEEESTSMAQQYDMLFIPQSQLNYPS
jgi:hypothetical protein